MSLKSDEAAGSRGGISVVEDDPYIFANGTDNQTIGTLYKATGSTRIEADFAFQATGNYNGHQQILFGKTAVLTASAPDAIAWQWYRDGIEIAGATGADCTVVWQKKPNATAVYSVKAYFDVGGETVVRDASATVTSLPCGLTIIMR